MKKWCLLVLLWATPVMAQTPITNWTARYYAVGAASPTQTNSIPAASVTCNLAPITSPITVNPTRIEWDDVANVGKVCRVDQSAVLLALPIGANYEGTLSATSLAGTSAESTPRSPFVRAAPPSVPSNVKVIQ